MKHLALATDYDGTLAQDGVVDPSTLAALHRFRRSGRKLILVTGRVLHDLETVFPHLDIFDCAVLENGAVLYAPQTRTRRSLAAPPPASLGEALRRRGVQPLDVGDVIVSTMRTNESRVREAIGELRLELDLIFNKNSVMILPPGIDKRAGLASALAELEISPRQVAAVGDAENDLSFLQFCGTSIAVANAIPALKSIAGFVTQNPRGAGVTEWIDRVLTAEQKDPHAQPVG